MHRVQKRNEHIVPTTTGIFTRTRIITSTIFTP